MRKIVFFLFFAYAECSSNLTLIGNRLRDPLICGNPLCKKPSKFNFNTNIKYEYSYNISTNTKFDGAGSNSSNLNLYALVTVQFNTECEGILEISNAEISYGNETNKNEKDIGKSTFLNKVLSENKLRFYFDDGSITQICPSPNETIWGLNIKKGILSAFQNTMDRFDVDQHSLERDINGDCIVGYFFKEVNGTTLVVSKKVELSTCMSRYQIYSIIPMTPYIFQKKYHKYTPINSHISCSQHIDHKIYKEVQCEEEHAYQPFYNQTNGAKTTSKSILALIRETNNTSTELKELKALGPVLSRNDLLFDHRRPKRATHDNLFECKKHIAELCKLHTVEFQPKYPDIFNTFIHIARDLSTDALSKLYKETSTICDTGRKHMLDALPYIRSRASTKVMTEVVLNKEIPTKTVHEWMLVMAFFPRPDNDIIDTVSNLLFQDYVDKHAMLSVSTMVHLFCEGNTDCGKHPSVIKIVERLESMFNETCKHLQNIGKAYPALRSIGNAGVLTPTLAKSLQACMENDKLPMEMRLSAISALRRLPCETNQKLLLSTLQNNTLDEELRIESYLQLMRCPSYSVLKSLKVVLETEEYNQVGSFIWSHLTNQLKSSMPSRVDVQAMLQDEHLSNKFNKDFRLYSRNYEASFFLNRFGIGGFYETNVIFTHKSYIPRQIMFNFTINIFGEAMNVYEVTIRLEGLEKYAEKLFAGDAAFSKNNFSKTFGFLRFIRSTSNPLKYLIDNIDFKKVIENVKISLAVKMFGNELSFYIINGHKDFVKVIDDLNPMQIIKDFLSGQEIKFDRSSMLIDTSYITPMSTGIPLKLNAISTAAINVTAKGFINSTGLSPQSKIELDGKLNPSFGINFEGSMLVDAFVSETGVKFKASVYTSTAWQGVFNMDTYKKMKVSFNLPLLKSDIFQAETKLLLIVNERELPLNGVTAGRLEKQLCSWSILDDAIGLRICASTLLPNTTYLKESPLFLLSGPLKFGISLIKSDPTATTYILEHRVESVNNKTMVIFEFQTPGSSSKRGMKAVIHLDTETQLLSLVYKSTLSHVEAQGYYKNTPHEKLLNFTLDINGKKHIDVEIGVQIQDGKYGNTYFPRLKLTINDKRIATLTGSTKWVNKKGISQCDINLDLITARFTTKVIGYLRLTEVSFATNIKLDYKFKTDKIETVQIELKLENKSTKFLTYYNGLLQLESTAYPEINMNSSLKYQKAQSHVDVRLDICSNPFNTNNDRDKMFITLTFQQYKSFSMKRLNTSLSVVKPNSDIDIKLEFSQKETATNTSLEFLINYATGKKIVMTLDINIPHGTLFYFESKFGVVVHAAAEHMVVVAKIYEKSGNTFEVEFLGTWFSGHSLSIKGLYVDMSTLVIAHHKLKLLARSGFFNDIIFNGKLFNSEKEYKIELLAEHNDIIYGANIKHENTRIGVYETLAEVQYNKTSYSLNNEIDINQRKNTLELHFDRYRDVFISVYGISNKSLIDAGLELKWDANRDPTQKITVTLLTISSITTREGKCIIEYPGRTINSKYFFQHINKNYEYSGEVVWSPVDRVKAYCYALYDLPTNGIAVFNGEVETPFNQWERTALSYQINFDYNKMNSNGSLVWQNNQRLDAEVSYNYLISPTNTDIAFISILNSSVPEVNSMKAILKLNQASQQFFSDFVLQTSPTNIFAIGLGGGIVNGENYTHYNGSFSVMTPFSILKKNSITADLHLFPDKFIGHVRLIGNGKKYMTKVTGMMKVISESILLFHIETPFEKYKIINGKFIFSANNKTIIANLRGSAPILETEILYEYIKLTNFNLKLKVVTSVAIVNRLLLIGKINSDTINLRFGLNSMDVGVTGRSHYTSWTDFDYGIKIFTPFQGYDKGSATAKINLNGKTDFEVSANLAEKRVGLKIESSKYPDEKFALPFIKKLDENTTYEIQPITLEDMYAADSVYWRGVYQFDTPMYPTVHGILQINEDENDYDIISYISFPFVKIRITDNLRFVDLMNIENQLDFISSCNCLKEMNSSFLLGGVLGSHVETNFDIFALSFDTLYKGFTKGSYDFVPHLDDQGHEGNYDILFDMETPLIILKKLFIHTKLNIENPQYGANLTLQINNVSVAFDANLETAEGYFMSDFGAKINSTFIFLPMARITIHKDFTDFEKKLDLGLALPNDRGNALVQYGIGGSWNYDAPRYMKCTLEIITPYPSIGTMRTGLEYSNNSRKEEYFVDVYLKYTNNAEMKAFCFVHKDKLTLKIGSTFEGFRDIHILARLKTLDGVKTIDAALSTDKEYKMLAWAAIDPNRPIMVEVKIFQTRTNSELFSIILNAQRKANGYDINGILLRKEHKINFDCDYVTLPDIGRKINLFISTTIKGYDSLKIETLLLNKGYELIVYKINGKVQSKWLTTGVETNGYIGFPGKGGVCGLSINHPKLITDFTISWLIDWFEHLQLDIVGKGSLGGDVERQQHLKSHFHFWNVDNDFQETSLSANIDFNNKIWWLCTNATLLWPAWNNFKFLSYIVLPHKMEEIHTTLGKFSYKKDLSYGALALKYFKHKDHFNFLSTSEIINKEDLTKGTVLLKTGKHRIFDNFVVTKIKGVYDLQNILQSTNMKEELSVKANWQQPSASRLIQLSLYYPYPNSVFDSNFDIIAINNFMGRINCSTPLKAFPRVRFYIRVVTTRPFYQRFALVEWNQPHVNNSALFNYTHASLINKEIQLTNGSIIVEFPLATKHTGHLNYQYKSTDKKAVGHSYLKYLGEAIMSGNYTRNSEFSDTRAKDKIEITVNNSFMPAGIIYNHWLTKKKAHQSIPFVDLKQIELYKLSNKSAFNVVGEYEVDQKETSKFVTLRGFNNKRRVIIESFNDGSDTFISNANFTLKPGVWAGSGLQINNNKIGKFLEFNVSYPHRIFVLTGTYSWFDSQFKSELTLHPNKFKKAHSISGALNWINNKPKKSHDLTFIIKHPTFDKDITFHGFYSKNETVIANLDLSVEYSMDVNKKLVVTALVKDRMNPIWHYDFYLFGKHPASRLEILGLGFLKMQDFVMEFNKNITYKRSYYPLRFWFTNGKISVKQKLIEIERKSLHDNSYVRGKYNRLNSTHNINCTVIHGKETKITSDLNIDIDNYLMGLTTNLTPDASETLKLEGWYKDNRHGKLSIWRTYNDMSITDVYFFVKLNHSRMLSSSIIWRPNIQTDVVDFLHTASTYVWSYAVDTANFFTNYIKTETKETIIDIWLDAKPIVHDFLRDIKDVRDLENDIDWFKQVFKKAYDANEFFMQDIYGMYLTLAEEMSFKEKMLHVPKIVNELWEVLGETGEKLRQSILWLVETIKRLYDQTVEFIQGLMTGETINKISDYLRDVVGKYDKIIKDMHISFTHYMEDLWREASDFIMHYYASTLMSIEPTFIEFAHHIESVFWDNSKKILEFLYEKQAELLKNSVFNKNSNFTKDLDGFYEDLTNNDFITNLKKYATLVYDIITEKYFTAVPFGKELNEIGSEIIGGVSELNQLPFVSFTIDKTKEIILQLEEIYHYLRLKEKLQQLWPIIYKTIVDLSHTALDNEMINHVARTKFIFDPHGGHVILEQKLPAPWHAFNETPNYEEIAEYKVILYIQKLLSPSTNTFWTYYYHYAPFLDPSTWLPPFDAHALIIGNKYFVTFDKKMYELSPTCSYLLANDFAQHTFSIVLKYVDGNAFKISVLTNMHIIDIDLLNNEVSVDDREYLHLPLQLNDTYILAYEGVATIRSPKGFEIKCNFKYDVCRVSLSGWYFGKTAGLLGTLDNEPKTDFLTPSGKLDLSIERFANSWSLGSCASNKPNLPIMTESNTREAEICNDLFNVKTSTFAPCYFVVDPKPFHHMCLTNHDDFEDILCTSAYAYIKACKNEFIPLKTPIFCIKCLPPDATLNSALLADRDIDISDSSERALDEGDLFTLTGSQVTQSTDVVFIMEAKACNQYMREKRMVQIFVSLLTKELDSVGLKNNRFSVVTFGGNGVYDEPQSVSVNNTIFTNERNIVRLFEKIKSGNGNTDIFGALRFATQLHYRPGVSKTFILIPCSNCDLSNMTVEYNVLSQTFIEQNITLHILMNAEFDFEKLRVSKMFYGLDSERAYTKNDQKGLKGDHDLRRQIKLTKSMLGFCTTLALETNGTIFTGKRMGTENLSLVKRFSLVFARRIAATAQPDSCQVCECSSNDDGIEYVECNPCSIPIPAYTDFDFKENGTLSFLNAFENIAGED